MSGTDQRAEILHLSGALLFVTGLVAVLFLGGVPLATVGSTSVPLAVGGLGLIFIASATYVAAYRRTDERWMLGRAIAAGSVVFGAALIAVAEVTGVNPVGLVGSALVLLATVAFAGVRWLPESTWERFAGDGEDGDPDEDQG